MPLIPPDEAESPSGERQSTGGGRTGRQPTFRTARDLENLDEDSAGDNNDNIIALDISAAANGSPSNSNIITNKSNTSSNTNAITTLDGDPLDLFATNGNSMLEMSGRRNTLVVLRSRDDQIAHS